MTLRYSCIIEQIGEKLLAIMVDDMSLAGLMTEVSIAQVEVVEVLRTRAEDLDCQWDWIGEVLNAYSVPPLKNEKIAAKGAFFQLANLASPTRDVIDSTKPLVIEMTGEMTEGDRRQSAIRRRHAYRGLESRRIAHIANAVHELEIDPWIVMSLDEFRLERANVGKHARDASKPWIIKIETLRGKYAVRQSMVGEYRNEKSKK